MELPTIAGQDNQGIPSVSLSGSYVFICAIDVGTIYSGFAYANKDDINFSTGTFNIHCNKVWNSGNPNLISWKTATCILLDKDRKIVAFGYEAEKQYYDLVEEGQAENYYCFRRFKMVLYEETPELMRDESGKELPPMVVFSQSIRALKDNFHRQLMTQSIQLGDNDIRWVITVPAIWSDAAKQFMRKCAIEAGLPNNQLILALEPEAASIYCQFVKSKTISDAQLTVSKQGTQYIVVDLGGGTADIVVHEIMGNGYLREIHAVRGIDCGGNSINESLVREITKTIGGFLLNSVKKQHPSVYLDIHREFEAAKKQFNPASNTKVSIRLPQCFLNALFKKMTNESLNEMVQLGPNFPGAEISRDCLKIEPQTMKSILFQPTVDRILNLVKDILKKINNTKLTKILLVGGLSESEFLQTAIKSEFPDKQVVVPEDAGLCVVKGAVLFGRDPNLISHRVVRYTYGLKIFPIFDKSIHTISKQTTIEGKMRCEDVFLTYVKIGTVVEIDKTVTDVLSTIYEYQDILKISVYISPREDPKYVDEDDCKLIGYLNVTIPNPTKVSKDVEVSLVFGNTELKIHAKELSSGENCETSLNLVHF